MTDAMVADDRAVDGGLTRAQAAQRLAEEGPNAVARPRPAPIGRRVLRQLMEPLVALLIAAFAVTLLLRDLTDAAVIGLVVVVNTAIGVVQEVRAERAISALDRLSAPTARVVRDGADLVIPAADVVRGDLVRVEAGDIVPADLTLTVAHRLSLDESALTGESRSVPHGVDDDLFAGTVVVVGRGAGMVRRTGVDSALGRIAALVVATQSGPTPLQRRLSSLGRILGGAIVALSALVFVLGLIAGRPVIAMAITAVSLVVAAVPESLPAVVTLALALGARRMAEHRAIPRHLHAVETLGSVTVIASDKTGTLTEGRMSVQRALDSAIVGYDIAGHGYEPAGDVRGPDGASTRPPGPVVDLARASLLCSDATVAPPTDDEPYWHAIGDPLEAALVTFAARCGLDPVVERAAWPRVAERPFDQAARRMTTLHRAADGRLVVICKGAPEALLAAPVVAGDVSAAARGAARLASAGLRVLAVAAAEVPGDDVTAVLDGEGHPRATDLRLLGLIGVGDPVRPSAPDTARAFHRAGVRLILVTGDHPGTATAVGDRIGIWHDGDDVMVHAHAADPARTDGVRVFARTQPDEKLDIIAALQARGHVVAMTGDGVNDAPALRKADIGVAMGGGTEVARQAADVVLVDDNLATVASAIGEGRRIYDNIRRFLHYGLAGGVAEILVMLLGPFLGLAVPLLPAQILWVNLLTHGVPGVAMGAEPGEPDVLTRPPRSPQESVLGSGLGRSVLGTGLALTVTVLAAGIAADRLGWPWQSIVFTVLGLGQLGIAIVVRSTRVAGGARNAALGWAIALSAVLQVAGVLFAPLRELLGTAPVTAVQLSGCAAAASVPALILVCAHYLGRRGIDARPSASLAANVRR